MFASITLLVKTDKVRSSAAPFYEKLPKRTAVCPLTSKPNDARLAIDASETVWIDDKRRNVSLSRWLLANAAIHYMDVSFSLRSSGLNSNNAVVQLQRCGGRNVPRASQKYLGMLQHVLPRWQEETQSQDHNDEGREQPTITTAVQNEQLQNGRCADQSRNPPRRDCVCERRKGDGVNRNVVSRGNQRSLKQTIHPLFFPDQGYQYLQSIHASSCMNIKKLHCTHRCTRLDTSPKWRAAWPDTEQKSQWPVTQTGRPTADCCWATDSRAASWKRGPH